MIWKDTIFTVISILNFFKSYSSQTFIKTKIILESNTIVFDPYNLFVFVNVWLLVFFKKFNMDIWVKMVSFQIIQNVLNLKTTLSTCMPRYYSKSNILQLSSLLSNGDVNNASTTVGIIFASALGYTHYITGFCHFCFYFSRGR